MSNLVACMSCFGFRKVAADSGEVRKKHGRLDEDRSTEKKFMLKCAGSNEGLSESRDLDSLK